MKIKAVIFDLDGTLFDSIGGIAFSLNKVLADNNLPTHDTEKIKTYVGEGIKKLLMYSLPNDQKDEATLMLFYEKMVDIYTKEWEYDFKFYEGMEELLDKLKEKNIKMAVNTNKNHDITVEIAKKYLAKWNITQVIGSQEKIANKPDPEGAITLMENMEIEPSECLFVGDSEVDVQTAHNAKIKAIGVTWGFRKREMLEKADAIIEHPLELLEYL